jgi:5-methylcytosine-specific restriction endonuclease McrA
VTTIPQDTSQKQCSSCKQIKSKDSFTSDKKNSDRLASHCKKCRNDKAKAKREAEKPPELPPAPEGHKRCRECKEVKLATKEFFNAVPSYISPDCLNRQCRECRKDYRRGHNKSNDKTINPKEEYKLCPRCDKKLPATLEYFSYRRATKDRLAYYCKECSKKSIKAYHARKGGKEARKAYRKANSERDKAYHKLYRALHRERDRIYKKMYNASHREEIQAYWHAKRRTEDWKIKARTRTLNRIARKKSAPGSHTTQDTHDQLKRQKHKCYYCGTKFAKGKHAYHVDHIIPLAREGTSNGPWNLVITCPTCNTSKGSKLPHEWPQGGRLL